MTENQAASARANMRRAISAFEAVSAYERGLFQPREIEVINDYTRARGQHWEVVITEPGRDPQQDRSRLAGMLCALRHLTDNVSGGSFPDALSAAHKEYHRQRAGYAQPAIAAQTAISARAIDVCENNIAAPRQYRDSFWPPDTLADLWRYASQQGISFETAMAGLTTGLITDLRHYADRQRIDFDTAMAQGHLAYTEQRLSAEGPFATGQDPGQRASTVLTPSAAAPPFRPVATHQGVVTSPGDAEWHLVRTAARTREHERREFPGPYKRDVEDQRALSDALGEMCGLPGAVILDRLAPQIAARVREIERGPAAAAALGGEHGRTGTPPYGGLDIDGDDTALFRALGETEWMTDASHPYRQALVTAYAEAYQQASTHGRPAAVSPARMAAIDFPLNPGDAAPQVGPAAAPDPRSSKAQRKPGTRPGHGRRGHA